MYKLEATTILHIERLAADAWPAAEVSNLDGWQLRATGGITGRANSVWPNQSESKMDMEAKLNEVSRFYQQRALPIRYQMTPVCQPSDLDQILENQGYAFYSPTYVQTVALVHLLERVTPLLAQPEFTPEFAIEIHDTFHPEWFETYCQSERVSGYAASVRSGILQRIQAAKGFALLRIAGQCAAIGLGVVQEGWIGFFNIETRAEFRQRGAASALLNALAIWAQAQGATNAYLQVMEQNLPAQRLYEKLGFSTLYRYHYRVNYILDSFLTI